MTARFLTSRQRDLLAFIEERIAGTGIAPSYDEMAAHMDLASKSGIHRLVSELEERGAIIRMPNTARGIALPPSGLTLSPELSAELRRRYGQGLARIEAAIRGALSTGATPP